MVVETLLVNPSESLRVEVILGLDESLPRCDPRSIASVQRVLGLEQGEIRGEEKTDKRREDGCEVEGGGRTHEVNDARRREPREDRQSLTDDGGSDNEVLHDDLVRGDGAGSNRVVEGVGLDDGDGTVEHRVEGGVVSRDLKNKTRASALDFM